MISEREMELMKLKSEISKSIDEESKDYMKYLNLSRIADQLGYYDIAYKLYLIAMDEEKHGRILREILSMLR